MRYTDYRYLNDPTELKYSVRLIKEAVLDSDIRLNHYLISMIFKFIDSIDEISSVYIASFSEKEKLSLWRYYGSNGTGFAIGFNQNFQKINPKPRVGASCICNVIYGETRSRDEINKYIRQCIEVLHQAGSQARENREFLKELVVIFISQIFPLLPILKDESFEEEKELRLVHIEGQILRDPNTGKPYFVDDQYREFVSIIPKYDIPFVNFISGNKPTISPDEFSASDISEIIIGPACEFSEARVAVRKLLVKNNFNVDQIEIRQAAFPYRP